MPKMPGGGPSEGLLLHAHEPTAKEVPTSPPPPVSPPPVSPPTPRTLADSSDDENSAPVHFDDTRVPTAAAAANADTSASEDEGEEHVRLEELLTEVEAALQAAQVLPDHVSRIRAIVEARGNRYELARSRSETELNAALGMAAKKQSIMGTLVAGFGPVAMVLAFVGLVAALNALYFDGGQCAVSYMAQRSQPMVENFIGSAPAWCRNFLMLTVFVKCCRKVSGFEDTSTLAKQLLVGDSPTAGHAEAAGWLAIVGAADGRSLLQKQSTWQEAMDARGFSTRQGVAMGCVKLLFWHWSQPLAYLWVLSVYKCELDEGIERGLACLVAAREVVYLVLTLLAVLSCPVFLILDPVTAWNEAETKLVRGFRVAAYVLTPHNYVALCLANRFRDLKVAFLVFAGLQVVSDCGSCFALVFLLAKQAEDGTVTPPALLIGFAITSASFVLFFGPMAVATNFSAMLDKTKFRATRFARGLIGCALSSSLVFVLVSIASLVAGVDIVCAGYTFNAPDCGPGTCSAGGHRCDCPLGFSPDGKVIPGKPMCNTHGLCPSEQIARVMDQGGSIPDCRETCCSGRGNCTHSGTCSCELGTGIGCTGGTDCTVQQLSDFVKSADHDQCEDVSGWYDALEVDCKWYGGTSTQSSCGIGYQQTCCEAFGSDPRYANFNLTADQACCICGGGTRTFDLPTGLRDTMLAEADSVCCGNRGIASESGWCRQCQAPYGGSRCQELTHCSEANTPCCDGDCTENRRQCVAAGLSVTQCRCSSGGVGEQCAPIVKVSNSTYFPELFGDYTRGDQICDGYPVYEMRTTSWYYGDGPSLPAFLFRATNSLGKAGWAIGIASSDTSPNVVDCKGHVVAFFSQTEGGSCDLNHGGKCEWKGCHWTPPTCSLLDFSPFDWDAVAVDVHLQGEDNTCALSAYGPGCGEKRRCVDGQCVCRLGYTGQNCTFPQCTASQITMAVAEGNARNCSELCCGGHACNANGTCAACMPSRNGEQCQYWSVAACQTAHIEPVKCSCDSVSWGEHCVQPRCWEANMADLRIIANMCSGYEEDGYICVGDPDIPTSRWCATIDPGGTPNTCANIAKAGTVVNPATGRCETPDGLVGWTAVPTVPNVPCPNDFFGVTYCPGTLPPGSEVYTSTMNVVTGLCEQAPQPGCCNSHGACGGVCIASTRECLGACSCSEGWSGSSCSVAPTIVGYTCSSNVCQRVYAPNTPQYLSMDSCTAANCSDVGSE